MPITVIKRGGMRSEPGLKPHDSADRSCYLLGGCKIYVLSSVSEKRSPLHRKDIDVEPRVYIERWGVYCIATHQLFQDWEEARGSVSDTMFSLDEQIPRARAVPPSSPLSNYPVLGGNA